MEDSIIYIEDISPKGFEKMFEDMESSHKNIEKGRKGCKTLTYQYANVSVPVTVRPCVNAGNAVAFCCGEPDIKRSYCSLKHGGNGGGGCRFTLSQCICIEVPIEFDANALIGTPCVECGEAGVADGCDNCCK